jgi:mannose-6-phosphate isomerase-like protein (cupin superfamily)
MSDSIIPNPFQLVSAGEGRVLGGVVCKISSASTGGAYTVLELSLPAGAGAPLHTHHHEDEVFYIMEGECEMECGGQTHLAQAGTVVVLPRHTPHAFRNPGSSPNRILITAVPGGLDEYFEALSGVAAADPQAAQRVAELNARHAIVFHS